MKKYLILIVYLIATGCNSEAYSQQETFTNPILPSGADPYSTYYNGYYYYTHTLQNRLVLWKTKSLADLKNAESKTIWTAPKNTDYSADIWAPEFHIINGKWYVYFAADNGNNNTRHYTGYWLHGNHHARMIEVRRYFDHRPFVLCCFSHIVYGFGAI